MSRRHWLVNNLVQVWLISWPLIIANSFWNLQITIDRIFLGEFSTDSLGAAIAATGFFWAPMALVQQTAAYVMTFVSQYWGAKQSQWIGPSLWQAIYVSVIGGVLFLTLIPLSPLVFAWMGHSQKMQSLEVEYFGSLAFSALPAALVAAVSGFYTGIGRSRIIILINAVGLIANVVFDYILIFGNFGGPRLGMAGAGWATTLANCCAAIVGLFLVFGWHGPQNFRLWAWKIDFELLTRFIRFGLPSGLQWALEGLAFTFFLAFLGRLPNGDSALSASSITVTVMMLAILPVIGVAQGVSALVGQHLGENKADEAVSVTWAGLALSLIYIVCIAMSLLIWPQFYMDYFSGAQPTPTWNEVSQLVPGLLSFVAVFIIFDSMNLIFSFTLKGAGDTRFVSLVALLLPWPIMVLPTWFVTARADGLYWSWLAASLFICLQGIIFLLRFLQGRWKAMRVI